MEKQANIEATGSYEAEHLQEEDDNTRQSTTDQLGNTTFKLATAKNAINTMETLFSAYSIDRLDIDYSGVSFKAKEPTKEKITNPKDKPNTNTENATSAAGKTLVSTEAIEGSNLPSKVANSSTKEINTGIDYKKPMKIFDTFKSIMDEIDKFVHGGRTLYTDMLVNEYIMGNFLSATDNLGDNKAYSLNNVDMRENHKLKYEVEYILYGKSTDQDNIKLSKAQIMLVRVVMNFIHVLADPMKRSTALGLATAMIGWTPLAFAVTVLQYAILFAWSVAEAAIDVMLLLKGERVAFYKTKGDWILGDAEGVKKLLNLAVDEVATKAYTEGKIYIENATQKMAEKAPQLIASTGDKAKTYANETYTKIFEDAYRLEGAAISRINTLVGDTIDSTANAIYKNIDIPPLKESIQDEQGDILSDVRKAVIANQSDIKKGTIEELNIIKEKIMNSYTGRLATLESNMREKTDSIIDNAVSGATKASVVGIKKGGELATKGSEVAIDEVSKTVKDQINKRFDAYNAKIMPNKAEISDTKVNLGLCYEDYLRLNLVLLVTEDSKLLRSMDCIQINMNKKPEYGGKFNFSNYLYDYKVTADVEMDYIFFNMPFMPKDIQEFGKNNKHNIKVTISNAY